MDWGGGKGSRAWRHAFNLTLPFHDTRFWYHSLIGQINVFMLTDSQCYIDSIAVFQYHTPTIQEIFLKTRISNKQYKFFCKLKTFGLSLGSKKSKKYVYELLQKEHRAFKIRQAFLVLSCDQLRSRLKSS